MKYKRISYTQAAVRSDVDHAVVRNTLEGDAERVRYASFLKVMVGIGATVEIDGTKIKVEFQI